MQLNTIIQVATVIGILFGVSNGILQGQEKSRPDPLGDSARAHQVIKLWPAKPPATPHTDKAEADLTKSSDELIAGRRIIKLGHVSTPEIHAFFPPAEKRNGCSVVVCPGGGFSILAWDLEGTEVATWLNSIGVTAFVVKYRVPTRQLKIPWRSPVQDVQRAVSYIRSNAQQFSINPDQIGVLGFSAGGKTTANANFTHHRYYPMIDEHDKVSFKANFVVLIYAALIIDYKTEELAPRIVVNESSPPTLMIHTDDDHVPVENAIVLHEALKKIKVETEFHRYKKGGHGYGMRPVLSLPVTYWPQKLKEWLEKNRYFASESDSKQTESETPSDSNSEPKRKNDGEALKKGSENLP